MDSAPPQKQSNPFQSKLPLILAIVGLVIVLIVAFLFIQNRSASNFLSPSNPIKVGVILYTDSLLRGVDGFKERMQELGYEEGKDIVYSETKLSNIATEISAFGPELIAEDVDVIYAITAVAAQSALTATTDAAREDIAIVFANAVIAPEAENNVTGITVDFARLTKKKLEFLKGINPTIKTIGIADPVHGDATTSFVLEALLQAVPEFEVQIIRYRVEAEQGPEGITQWEGLLSSMKPGDIDAYFQIPAGVITNGGQDIEMTKRVGIPGVWFNVQQVEQGALFAVEHDLFLQGKQAADMMHKVLQGTTPSDIPIETPKQDVLWINLQTAKEANVTIPESWLQIADRIIPAQ